MSDLELLRRALGEDRHARGAQIMEALRVRIEQKKKNLAFTWKNSYLLREVAIRIDVKVTPNDSQVFLDDQLRAAEQRKTRAPWGLHPRGEEWRWIRDEVRVDVEHVTWWDAPARPVLAVIINRPWAAARPRAELTKWRSMHAAVMSRARPSLVKESLISACLP